MNKFLSLVNSCTLDNTCFSLVTLDDIVDEVIVQIRISSSQAREDSTDFDYLAAQMVSTMCELGTEDLVGDLGHWQKIQSAIALIVPSHLGRLATMQERYFLFKASLAI